MNIRTLHIEGLLLLTPEIFADMRGYFSETYRREVCREICGTDFVQDNESMSHKHVVRGLHFQLPPHAQDKLVRVVSGSILDVAVDLRSGSPTYGKHAKVELSAENKRQFFIPKGFAHGFISLENHTIVQYKCSAYYHKASEGTLLWNDPDLNIDWEAETVTVSEKDRNAMRFKQFFSPF